MARSDIETGLPLDIIESHIERLKKVNYKFSHYVHFDSHCVCSVSRGSWSFTDAMIHNGRRESIQRQINIVTINCINAAWTHFHEYIATEYSQTRELLNFGLWEEKAIAHKRIEELNEKLVLLGLDRLIIKDKDDG